MRITQKTLEGLVKEVNEKCTMEIMVFPNMYGYGIAPKEGVFTNIYNGKANECYAFLKGMLTGLKFADE